MSLSPAFFHGCVRCCEGDGVELHRFTDHQMAYFHANPRWLPYARCIAGASWQARTDAEAVDIELSVSVVSENRSWFCLDCLVDGSLHTRLWQAQAQPLERHRVALPPGEKSVVLVLPHTLQVAIKRIEPVGASLLEPLPPRPRSYVAFGDSITQGFDARHPANSYPFRLAAQLDMELLNRGVGGHIFAADLIDPAEAPPVALVTVAYGTNDWGFDLSRDTFDRHAEAFLRVLLAAYQRSRPVIAVISPLWRADWQETRPGGTLREFSAVLRDVCGRLADVRFLDGWDLVPHRSDCFGIGCHPNDDGFAHVADGLHTLLGVRG